MSLPYIGIVSTVLFLYIGLIHTDDRCALIEVARQLNAASQLEEMINVSLHLGTIVLCLYFYY